MPNDDDPITRLSILAAIVYAGWSSSKDVETADWIEAAVETAQSILATSVRRHIAAQKAHRRANWVAPRVSGHDPEPGTPDPDESLPK
jgi:hypothetical protein